MRNDLQRPEVRLRYLRRLVLRAERILQKQDRQIKRRGLPKNQAAREMFMSEHMRALNFQRQVLAQIAGEKAAVDSDVVAPYEVESETEGEEGGEDDDN